MTRLVVLAGLALANACTAPLPEPDPDTPVSSDDTPAASPAPTGARSPKPASVGSGSEVATLEGEWRVAGIDGEDFDEDYGIALSATRDAILFSPSCAGADRQYAIDGARFRAWVADADQQKAICEIGLPPGMYDMWRAIDAANRIERTASNGVLLSGGGHSLLLFSQ